MRPGARLSSTVLWWVGQAAGAVFLLYAARIWLHAMRSTLAVYDEGIILTDAFLLRQGYWPYRDFYTNYPPGAFLTVNGAWALLGQTVQTERALGGAVRLVLTGLAGRVAGRAVGRPLALLPMGLAAVWLTLIGPAPYAWLQSLAAALLAIELSCMAFERRRPSWWALCGLAVASIGFFRHDLLVCFLLCSGAVLGVWTFLRKRDLAGPEVRGILLPFLGAFAAACLLFWGPLLWVGGVRQVVDDLFLNMVRYVMPARILPVPRLIGWGEGGPIVLVKPLEFGVAVTLLGPGFAGVAWLLWRKSAPPSTRLPLALLAALSMAVIPHMSGRSDLTHSVYTVTPGLVLLFVMVFRLRSWPAALVATLLATFAVAWPVRSNLGVAFNPLRKYASVDARLWNIPYDRARQDVVADVRSRTRPDERIYVGLVTHRFTFISEMELYFLAERAGGVRRMQFDPGLSNRELSQRESIAELERNQVRVAVLSHNYSGHHEANESRHEGSGILDDYFRAHFGKVAQYGPYEVWQRLPEARLDEVDRGDAEGR